MSSSNWGWFGILPQALLDLTGLLGDRVKRTTPESRIIAKLGGGLREIRDTSEMSVVSTSITAVERLGRCESSIADCSSSRYSSSNLWLFVVRI